MTRITDTSFRLRDDCTPPALPALPRLGLDLGKLHKPTLKLADYLHAESANPPAAVSRPTPASNGGCSPTTRSVIA